MSISTSRIAHIDRTLRRAASSLAAVGVGVLLLQGASIVIEALARWLFDMPLHGLEDANLILLPVTIASFMPALFLERGNVAIDLLGLTLGPRTSAWLTVFGQTGALIFVALIAREYAIYASMLENRHTVIVELPKQPTAWIAAGIFVATVVLQAFVVARSAVYAAAGAPPGGGQR